MFYVISLSFAIRDLWIQHLHADSILDFKQHLYGSLIKFGNVSESKNIYKLYVCPFFLMLCNVVVKHTLEVAPLPWLN